MENPFKEILKLVNKQAENDGLWFNAEYITEAYLQKALRDLHAVIEYEATKTNK